MADQNIKSLTENLPAPVFETVAFHSPPPLSEATVAIVTSASLHHPDQEDFFSADDMEEALSAFIRIAEGTPWGEAGLPGLPPRVAQDIRAFYELAALGLSDHVPSA